MTPVDQDRFGGPNVAWDQQGNCHAACLASIFEVPLSEIPEPAEGTFGPAWYEPHEAWLAERGWETQWLSFTPAITANVIPGDSVEFTPPEPLTTSTEYAILGGLSPRGLLHATVCRLTPKPGGIIRATMAHDPHPRREGLTTVEDLQLFRRRPGGIVGIQAFARSGAPQ